MRSLLKTPLYLQTLVAMILGIAVGAVFGDTLGPLSQLSKLIVQWIKILATPLLFFAILDGILNGQMKGRGVKAMLGISAINGTCAIAIALFISNTFHAGKYLQLKASTEGAALAKKGWDWTEAVKSFVPESLVGPFVNNAIPSIILIAIFFGLAARVIEAKASDEERRVFDLVRSALQVAVRTLLKVMDWFILLIPLAVFASVAKVVGEHGLSILGGLGAYLAVTLSGMAIQIIFVYQAWIKLVAKKSLRVFWREAREPALYAFGVNSSLATLPVTLKALDRIGVTPAAARLSACVGTNLNNDGILLYEVVAAFFIAQANGIDIPLFHQVALAAICVLATIGVAGIPEAGIISLFLVLNTAGLPAESLPLLLSVDWVVARCRSVTNVLADMTVAVGVDHFSPLDERPA